MKYLQSDPATSAMIKDEQNYVKNMEMQRMKEDQSMRDKERKLKDQNQRQIAFLQMQMREKELIWENEKREKQNFGELLKQ